MLLKRSGLHSCLKAPARHPSWHLLQREEPASLSIEGFSEGARPSFHSRTSVTTTAAGTIPSSSPFCTPHLRKLSDSHRMSRWVRWSRDSLYEIPRKTRAYSLRHNCFSESVLSARSREHMQVFGRQKLEQKTSASERAARGWRFTGSSLALTTKSGL